MYRVNTIYALYLAMECVGSSSNKRCALLNKRHGQSTNWWLWWMRMTVTIRWWGWWGGGGFDDHGNFHRQWYRQIENMKIVLPNIDVIQCVNINVLHSCVMFPKRVLKIFLANIYVAQYLYIWIYCTHVSCPIAVLSSLEQISCCLMPWNNCPHLLLFVFDVLQ